MPDPTTETETPARPLSRRALLAGVGVVAASPAAALLLGAGGSSGAARSRPSGGTAAVLGAPAGVRRVPVVE